MAETFPTGVRFDESAKRRLRELSARTKIPAKNLIAWAVDMFLEEVEARGNIPLPKLRDTRYDLPGDQALSAVAEPQGHYDADPAPDSGDRSVPGVVNREIENATKAASSRPSRAAGKRAPTPRPAKPAESA